MDIADVGGTYLEEDLKHLRTLLPYSSVHCALPVIVSAVWARTTLQQHANHLHIGDGDGGTYVL